MVKLMCFFGRQGTALHRPQLHPLHRDPAPRAREPPQGRRALEAAGPPCGRVVEARVWEGLYGLGVVGVGEADDLVSPRTYTCVRVA